MHIVLKTKETQNKFSGFNELKKSYSVLCEKNQQQRYLRSTKTLNFQKELKAISAMINPSIFTIISKYQNNTIMNLNPPLPVENPSEGFTENQNIKKRTHNKEIQDSQRNQNTEDSEENDSEDEDPLGMLQKFFLFVLVSYMGVLLIQNLLMCLLNISYDFITWKEFYNQMLSKGLVEQIVVKPELGYVFIYLYEGSIIEGKEDKKFPVFVMNFSDIKKFEQKLKEAERQLGMMNEVDSMPVVYERGEKLLLLMIPIFIFAAFMLMARKRVPLKKRKTKITYVKPISMKGREVKFEDIAGLTEAKIEIMELVNYVKHPKHYEYLGAKLPRGVLLLGPPGCGKTLLAKAVATESNVPFFSMSGPEFVKLYGGVGAQRVRQLFLSAKRYPCSIIYIDEVDAVGRARSIGLYDNGEMDHTLAQLLIEMDGINSYKNIIVFASTNRADLLDKALLRPGRLSRHILIDLPTLQDREEIFQHYLKKMPLKDTPANYSKTLSALTPGLSPADIANVCNEAIMYVVRLKKNVVTLADLEYGIEKQSLGKEKRYSGMSQQEKEIMAYHKCGHVLVSWMLESTNVLSKVSITSRTNSALGIVQLAQSEKKIHFEEELFDRMCMLLGGRAAEVIVFNSTTTAAKEDFEMVLKLAKAQVQYYGMNKKIGLIALGDEHEQENEQKIIFSKTLKALIDNEISLLVSKAYFTSKKVIEQNRVKLEILSRELLKKETLTCEEIEKLIGPPPHGEKKRITSIELELTMNKKH